MKQIDIGLMKQIDIGNEEEMLAFGGRIANELHGGEFIATFGDLGAGKTTLVRGLAGALGIDNISSPTFNIVKHHSGRLPLEHFDCYRLSDYEELMAIGFDDYLANGSIIVMEWCERVQEALPCERLEIHIEGSGSDTRIVKVKAFGERYERIMEVL